MNKTDSPLVYSCAFWGLFCRFGRPSYGGNDSDFKERPKRQNKPQNAQEYTRGESVLFILLS